MAKKKNGKDKSATSGSTSLSSPLARKRWLWGTVLAVVLVCGGAIVTLMRVKEAKRAPSSTRTAPPLPISSASSNSVNPATALSPAAAPELETMEVEQAVMVTVELDFGAKLPSIAEALRQIERRYEPDDGEGRTFAIIDAYGQPTSDGKLHLSMHVSSEKPGLGALVFRSTGEILWNSRIVPGAQQPPAKKNLGISLSNGTGGEFVVDGSNNPHSILEARVRDLDRPVREVWPDGAEREVAFIYSACGCPVKVMARRVDEWTVRTKEQPVIFPDDPAVVTVIGRLMKW